MIRETGELWLNDCLEYVLFLMWVDASDFCTRYHVNLIFP